MPPGPNVPASNDGSHTGGVPPRLVTSAPPLLAPEPDRKSVPAGQTFAILLSLGIGLFLAEAVVSLADDSLILFFDVHVLGAIRGMLFLVALLVAVVIYGLMGLTPMIPKRLFLPLTLFNPVAGLAVIPLAIYFNDRLQQVAWGISLFQAVFSVGILGWVQGGLRFHWPLVAVNQLEGRRFSWQNLTVFALVNVFGVLPAVIVYSIVCVALAVGHFSDGFLALRPAGLTVQARKYVRDDGKTIQLVPMAHIGEPAFYRKLAQSFPTNSIILMEGVSDYRNLLTNRISYKRMATTLGVAEQSTEFKPSRGEMVSADVDVAQFATNTIDFLNLVMLLHSKGMRPDIVLKLMEYSPPPNFEEQLFDDLLQKRNRHLLNEIHARLLQSAIIIVPWGAAHMPEIAREIQKSGFRLDETQDYVAIGFRSTGRKSESAGKEGDSEKLE